jgi:hypothetical protein
MTNVIPFDYRHRTLRGRAVIEASIAEIARDTGLPVNEVRARLERLGHDHRCRRCGASEQATHAPWCQHRDGTPTAWPSHDRCETCHVREAVEVVAAEEGLRFVCQRCADLYDPDMRGPDDAA